jgi:CheY-like chemotaxis protein
MVRVFGLLLLVPLVVACQAMPVATPPMDGQALANHLRSSPLPITQVEVFTAESDTNQLLGRPTQYIAKVSWRDSRLTDTISRPTIEGFANMADLNQRATYTEAISKSGGAFAQYIFRNDRRLLLMRLPHELTPDQAEEYRAWLNKL